MIVTSKKAPSKTQIAKATLFTLFTIAAASNNIVLEANAQEQTQQIAEEARIEEDTKVETTSRYVNSTFGELLDTKYCETEEHIEYVTEKVCKEGDYKYVTPELLESIAYQESKFVKDAENGSAITMYQIKPHFHEEEMNLAGVTLDEIKTCTEAQTKFAAEVVEKYAEEWAEEGIPEEDILKAAVTNYHLTQETADEKIESRNWDGYTNAVMERTELITKNKALQKENSFINPSLHGKGEYELAI